jgi:hypothetical protein
MNATFRLALAGGVAALLVLPTAAGAVECDSGIATVAEKLGLQEQETESGVGLSRGTDTEKGTAIEEDGGTTVYAETGVATPRENWFGDSPDKAEALGKLEQAMDARAAGEGNLCVEHVQEALDILEQEQKEEADESGTE